MGFVKSLFGGAAPAMAGLLKSDKDKAAAPKSTADMDSAEETARRKRAAEMAASQPGQLTAAGGVQGAATLTRKTLLGL